MLTRLFERGLAPVIITTGGAGKDPHFSEGQVGRDYLESRGFPTPISSPRPRAATPINQRNA